MSILKLFKNIEVEFDSVANEFDICRVLQSGDVYDHVSLTFDQIEQLYTWAASMHEQEAE